MHFKVTKMQGFVILQIHISSATERLKLLQKRWEKTLKD